MRHLWTMVTTVNTVTSDAGEPEWLDLPLEDFVLPAAPEVEELPLEQQLDPAWLIQSRWIMEEFDVGNPFIPIVEFRDPLGITLYDELLTQDEIVPQDFSTDRVVLSVVWDHIWYTVPGVYILLVRWAGPRTTGEDGRFSLKITDFGSAANHE